MRTRENECVGILYLYIPRDHADYVRLCLFRLLPRRKLEQGRQPIGRIPSSGRHRVHRFVRSLPLVEGQAEQNEIAKRFSLYK